MGPPLRFSTDRPCQTYPTKSRPTVRDNYFRSIFND
jgi:hypothetical protein